MGVAILRITNGTDTVNFLGGPFYLFDYTPGIPTAKDDGIFIDSPLSDGRRLAYSVLNNAVDRYDFMLKADSGDDSDDYLASLMALIRQAENHWKTNGRISPVWIEERSSQHSTIKYARIVTGSLQGLGNRFSQPYLQSSCSVLDNELILLIERKNWKSVAPGTVENLSVLDNSYPINVVKDQSLEEYGLPNNPWFESLTPDTTLRTTEKVYDGLYSVRVTDSGAEAFVSNDVALDSGVSVTVTAKVYVVSGTGLLRATDGGGTANPVNASTTTTGQWVELSVNKTASALGIRVNVGTSGSSDVYVDDVKILISYGPGASSTVNPVYISNGRGDAPISHIFRLDSPSTYSSNLVDSTPPYSLLPSSPAVGDACYFGSQTGYSYGGPFSNVIVNLSSTTDVTIVWEYWDGSSWSALDVNDESEAFSVSGKSVVSWSVPPAWATTTVNSEVCYWVRARVSAVGGGGNAQQQTSAPYTVAGNYVEISGANITGDYDPSIRLTVNPESMPIRQNIIESVTAGSDDGDWDTAAGPPGSLTNATVQLGQDQTILLRFSAVDIPQGAIISRARLQATSAGSSGGGTANYKVAIELADNSATLSAAENPDSSRTYTNNDLLWNIPDGFWAANNGNGVYAPDVTDMVQEVVDRTGWVSGNAMVFRIKDDAVTATHYRTFSMYENDTDSWGLEVVFIEPETYTSGFVIGARATNRGSDFRSCVNLSPYQSDSVSVSTGVDSNFSSFVATSTGFLGGPLLGLGNNGVLVSPATTRPGIIVDRVEVIIPSPLSRSFSGKFRAFIRAAHDSVGPNEPTSFRLRVSIGGESFLSPLSSMATSPYPELVDMGTIVIPEATGLTTNTVKIAIQSGRPDVTRYLITDLILIPSDEWICEVKSPRSIDSVLKGDDSLIIDGIDSTDGLLAEISTDRGRSKWTSSGTPAKLEVGNTVRLWFVAYSDLSIDSNTDSEEGRSSFSGHIHSVSLDYVREYLIGRGTG